ncbi:MAG: T9SS type A sorting domain-containing protein [Melioribacteraceae bacterium]|nr:T9SS type A sorting domain-containing protein [Melioribacteraceae bacterium]
MKHFLPIIFFMICTVLFAQEERLNFFESTFNLNDNDFHFRSKHNEEIKAKKNSNGFDWSRQDVEVFIDQGFAYGMNTILYENGKIKTNLLQVKVFDELSSSYVVQNRNYEEYSYTQDGSFSEIISSNWTNNGLREEYRKAVYIYDDQMKLQEQYIYRKEDSDWIPMYKRIYTYENDLIIKRIEQINFGDGSDWINDRQHLFNYDENGNRIEWIDQNWDGEQFVNSNRELMTYDDFDKLIEVIRQLWRDEQYVNYRKYNLSYNSNDLEEMAIYYYWDQTNSIWLNDTKTEYFYNEQDLLIERSYYLWENSGWNAYFTNYTEYGSDPFIVITSPSAATALSPDQNMFYLDWLSFNVQNIDIEFSSDAGQTWNYIAENTLANQQYLWTLPQNILDDCKLRFSDSDNPEVSVEMDGTFSINPVTNIEDDNYQINLKFRLDQNYPNPFNPTTKIMFSIAKTGFVNLSIYDNLGQKVKELVNENKSAGQYTAEFEGSGLASGIYYYKLEAGNYTEVKKMILLR